VCRIAYTKEVKVPGAAVELCVVCAHTTASGLLVPFCSNTLMSFLKAFDKKLAGMIVHGGIQLPSPSVNGISLQAIGNLVKFFEKKLKMKECCQGLPTCLC
jgi:ABC-type phosphate/phosphonate transport system permease subunit